MSGIYLHIPFCKKACHYCNFHFSTSLKLKHELIDALCREIGLRADYLGERTLSSIYFGGGTPSFLDKTDLEHIWDALHKHFAWDKDIEITLEANPDDLNYNKVKMLRDMGINRLSIGVQSFFDTDLQWMNRAHNEKEAVTAILNAQEAGITNLTIDLIYGSPYTTHSMWQKNIFKAMDMGIQHISAYCLTVEERTALHHMIKKGSFKPLNSESATEQFTYLMDTLTGNGYEHYEISNFAKPGFRAVHNTNYWQGVKYLGIGPAAHSYNGSSRSWNIANNKKYTDAITNGKLPQETEIITPAMKYNEYIMTGLRTVWGVETAYISNLGQAFLDDFLTNIEKHLISGDVMHHNNQYYLSRSGKYFADRIAMDLFWVEE